jgi:hypothetical protein
MDFIGIDFHKTSGFVFVVISVMQIHLCRFRFAQLPDSNFGEY